MRCSREAHRSQGEERRLNTRLRVRATSQLARVQPSLQLDRSGARACPHDAALDQLLELGANAWILEVLLQRFGIGLGLLEDLTNVSEGTTG